MLGPPAGGRRPPAVCGEHEGRRTVRTSTRMTLAAGAAVALGAAPLGAVFEEWSWIWYAWAAVAAVVGAHLLARSLRLPAVLVPVAGALGLLLYLTFIFASEGALLGLVPTPDSLELLRTGLERGLANVNAAGRAGAGDGRAQAAHRRVPRGGRHRRRPRRGRAAAAGGGRAGAARALRGAHRRGGRRRAVGAVRDRRDRLPAAPAGRGPGPAAALGASGRHRRRAPTRTRRCR